MRVVFKDGRRVNKQPCSQHTAENPALKMAELKDRNTENDQTCCEKNSMEEDKATLTTNSFTH